MNRILSLNKKEIDSFDYGCCFNSSNRLVVWNKSNFKLGTFFFKFNKFLAMLMKYFKTCFRSIRLIDICTDYIL